MVCGKYEYFSSLGSMSLEARKQRDNEEDEKNKLRCGDIITKIKAELSLSNTRTTKTHLYKTIEDILNRPSTDYNTYKTIRHFVFFNNRNQTKLSIIIIKLLNLNN